MESEQTRSPADARAALAASGITVRAWSKANGVSESTVHGLLSGRKKGRYGEAHRAAVLLGLKPGYADPRPVPMAKASSTTLTWRGGA